MTVRVRRVGTALAVALGLLVASCSSDGDAEADVSLAESTQADGDAVAAPTSSSTTATTLPSTTETTLTAAQQQFQDDIALAERLMEPIRSYGQARRSCYDDPPSCDRAALTNSLVDGLRELELADIDELVEGRYYYEAERYERYFVQHFIDRLEPVAAQVWTCQSISSSLHQLDADGNEILEDPPVARELLTVFVVAEQADGELLIEQVKVLNEDGDPKPEGGTCDSYKDWPPPLPSS